MNCSKDSRIIQVMAIEEKTLAEELQREDFRQTYVWQDGPNASYAEHIHNGATAHIILSGEMTLTMYGEAKRSPIVPVNDATFRRERPIPCVWGRRVAAT